MSTLNTQYSVQRTNRISTIEEQEVYRLIHNHQGEDYTDVLQEEERFFLHFHLSDYRSSILRWYPFKEDASVLEIDAGLGAVTGALCDRVSKVTVTENSLFCAKAIQERYKQRENLTIYAADYKQVPFDEKFDYIIAFGNLEREGEGSDLPDGYAKYIDYLLGLLKPDGVLLLEVENQYGIHNLYGKRDSHTGIPFDALAGYPDRKEGRGFHKAELETILKFSQADSWKFYYPMPDYIVPRAIYTDSVQPGENIQERLAVYTKDGDNGIGDEFRMYVDAAKNGVYSFVSNHFLVEIAAEQSLLSDVNYVTLSTTRSREKSFAVVVHENTNGKLVEKRPLYSDGVTYARYLCECVKDLEDHNINILPMHMEGDSIWMEYIEADTVQQYLTSIVSKRLPREEFLTVFDKLWENICRSSEITEEYNADLEDVDRKILQPILKYAYLELIPSNSFWKDNNILYFDQEFIREGYPAKFVLMRSIIHTYGSISGCEQYCPRKVLFERYKITQEVVDIFLELEHRFDKIENSNKIDVWSHNSWEEAQFNRNLLAYKNISLFKRFIDKDSMLIKKVYDIQIRILYRLKELCEKHHLTYYLMYGSLLGAVRHQGKIPGDDDIDVALPREDYDKLLHIAQEELEPPFFLQTPSNDNCFYGGYSKMMNLDSTVIVEQNWYTDCKEGIYIDIFPLDYGYVDQRKEKKKNRKITFYQRLLFAKAYGYFASFRDMPLLIWKAYKYFGKLYTKEKLVQLLDVACKEGDRSGDAPYGVYTHYMPNKDRKLFAVCDFEECLIMHYETLNMPVPSGYDHILRTRYGKDYMQMLQHQVGERLHGFYAVKVPSVNYKKRFQGGWRVQCCNKKIVLFGDPFIIEQYLKYRGGNFAPALSVYDTKAPWNFVREDSILGEVKEYIQEAKDRISEQYKSVKVVSWEQFEIEEKELLGTETYPIICTVNIRETEWRLRRSGIREYYIFAYDRAMIALKEPLEYILMEGERNSGR